MFEMTTSENRLRVMYALNLLGGGVPGALMILAPVWALENMFAGTQEPAMFGMTGAIWMAIGIGSIIGFFRPNLMKGLFILQIFYKSIWVAAVAIPLMLSGSMTVLPMVIFFMLIVVGWTVGLFGGRLAVENVAATAII